MTESPPIAWQEIDGKRHAVKVSFQLQADNRIGFKLGDYHTARPVFIDPVTNGILFTVLLQLPQIMDGLLQPAPMEASM
jgi:hypothetical protein